MKKYSRLIAFYVVVFIVAILLKQLTIIQITGVVSGETNKILFLVYLIVLHFIAAYGLLSPIFNRLFSKKTNA